ncbi:hypothetical protein BJ912DRAFT_888687, partial [Pholiota molesta]
MKVTELKQLCRTRGLSTVGKKAELIERLSTTSGNHSRMNTSPQAAEKDPSSQPGGAELLGVDIVQIDGRQVHADAEKMLGSFEAGYNQGDENFGDDDDDELGENVHNPGVVDTPRTHDALAWVDKFILDTRRKSGRVTENSVLKLWR